MANVQGQAQALVWHEFFAHMKVHGGSISFAYYLANSLNAYQRLPASVRDEFRGVLNDIIAKLNLDEAAIAGFQAIVDSKTSLAAFEDGLRDPAPKPALALENINGQQEEDINQGFADVLNWLAAADFDQEQVMDDPVVIEVLDYNPFGLWDAAGNGDEHGAVDLDLAEHGAVDLDLAEHGDVDLDLPGVEDQAEDDLEFFDVSDGEEDEEEEEAPFQNIIGQHEEAIHPFIEVEDWLAADGAVDYILFDAGIGQPPPPPPPPAAAAATQPYEIYAVLHLSLNVMLIAFVAYQLYRKSRKNRQNRLCL